MVVEHVDQDARKAPAHGLDSGSTAGHHRVRIGITVHPPMHEKGLRDGRRIATIERPFDEIPHQAAQQSLGRTVG